MFAIREPIATIDDYPCFLSLLNSPISGELRSMENAMVVFTVKDRDLFGISNQYLAECFLTMAEITSTDKSNQIHLSLSRPQSTGVFLQSYIPTPIAHNKKFFNLLNVSIDFLFISRLRVFPSPRISPRRQIGKRICQEIETKNGITSTYDQ